MAPAGSAAAADREPPDSARARGCADRPDAVAVREFDPAGWAASAGLGKVRKPARSEGLRAPAAAAPGARGDVGAAGGRHRVAHRAAGRDRAADARPAAVRKIGTRRVDSRAAPSAGVGPEAGRPGAGRVPPRGGRRTADPGAAYRAGRRDADSRVVTGAGRQGAGSGALRQVARRTADSVAGRGRDCGRRARGYGCRAREGAVDSRHTDPPPGAGPARPGAGRRVLAAVPDRPAARSGAAAVAARGRIRGRYRAGCRSSPAPIREPETPAPTVHWGPAGRVDRRAVYRAVADERRIHRRSSCLLYRPDPRLPVVPCVVPNTSPPLLRATNCTVRAAGRIRPRTGVPDGPGAPMRAPLQSSMGRPCRSSPQVGPRTSDPGHREPGLHPLPAVCRAVTGFPRFVAHLELGVAGFAPPGPAQPDHPPPDPRVHALVGRIAFAVGALPQAAAGAQGQQRRGAGGRVYGSNGGADIYVRPAQRKTG